MSNDHITHFFGSGAVESGKYVSVRYISYQGSSNLTKEHAQEYLKYIRTADNPKKFKHHFQFLRGC